MNSPSSSSFIRTYDPANTSTYDSPPVTTPAFPLFPPDITTTRPKTARKNPIEQPLAPIITDFKTWNNLFHENNIEIKIERDYQRKQAEEIHENNMKYLRDLTKELDSTNWMFDKKASTI